MVTMTTYVHWFPGLVEQAADRLDRLRDGPETDPAALRSVSHLS